MATRPVTLKSGNAALSIPPRAASLSSSNLLPIQPRAFGENSSMIRSAITLSNLAANQIADQPVTTVARTTNTFGSSNLEIKSMLPTVNKAEVTLSSREHKNAIAEMELSLRELPLNYFESVSIGYMSPARKRNRSSVTISKEANELDQTGTVNDPRMGSIGHAVCTNCRLPNCTGHFGIIEFADKVYNPLTMGIILDILTSVCNFCGGLLLTREVLAAKSAFTLKEIAKISKDVTCKHVHKAIVTETKEEVINKICSPNPTYFPVEINKKNRIMFQNEKVSKSQAESKVSKSQAESKSQPENKVALTAAKAFIILDAISDEDAKILGFTGDNHPRNFIMENILIPSLVSRPPAYNGTRLIPNSMTVEFNNLVKINIRPPAADSGGRDFLLQMKIKEIIEGTDTDSKRSHSREFQSINDMIKGKKGIVRGTMMGKRGNYCARSILSPGPNLRLGQIYVPRIAAPYLRQNMMVNQININAVRRLVIEEKISGYSKNGQWYEIFKGKVYEPEIGDEVERHLQDGDYVLFNRQPTLHKQSLMGHEVVLWDNFTIGIHVSATTSYNADFDGDEGNLYAPMTEEGRAEARNLVNIGSCLMSSQTNRPNIGSVMDATTGTFVMTMDDNIDPMLFNNYLMAITASEDYLDIESAGKHNNIDFNNLNNRLKAWNVPRFTGRALFSAVLPPDFFYEKKSPNKDAVIIRDGVLVSGFPSKADIGLEGNSITQRIFHQYGSDRLVKFISDLTFLATSYITNYGWTVGALDCNLEDEGLKQVVKDAIRKMRSKVKALETDVNISEKNREKAILKAVSSLEGSNTALVSAFTRGRPIQTFLDENLEEDQEVEEKRNVVKRGNLGKSGFAIGQAISGYGAGAKGTLTNVSQISTAVGQQKVGGGRLEPKLAEGTRCSPYFAASDKNLESRGYCPTGFHEGLDAPSLYFHSLATRPDLINTSVNTSVIGDIRRKMVKSNESVTTTWDGSVRDGSGKEKIISYLYGNTGFAVDHLVDVSYRGETVSAPIDIFSVVESLNLKAGWYKKKIIRKDENGNEIYR